MKHLLYILIFLCCISLSAVELINIKVDFEGSNWNELLSTTKNASVVEREDGGHAMHLPPFSNLSTPKLPYAGGDILIDFDTTHTAIERDDAEWKVGLAWVVYFAGEQALGHQDLYYAKDAREWHHEALVRNRFKVNAATTHFQVVFNNFGRNGTQDIDNVHIRVTLDEKNLCGDQSFNGTPSLDHWFPARPGDKDWDDLPLASEGAQAEYISGVFPGAKAAHLYNGTATMTSARYPYNGEELIIGAWYRQKGIVRGSQGWCGAGIQVALYDEHGDVVGHKDLLPLVPGDAPWKYYQMRIPSGNLGRAVKSFRLFSRIFDGGKGDLWMSEVAVVARKGADLVPYDISKGAISVDAASPAENPIVAGWDAMDLSYATQLWEPPVAMHALKGLKEAGFTRIRMREFMNGYDFITGWENGKPVTDFTKIDKGLDPCILEYGFIPTITLGSTPASIATKKHSHFCNHYPPKDYALWGEAVYALVAHWIERYGKDAVAKWCFECWNEPSSTGFFLGTLDEYKQIVSAMFDAAERIEKDFGVHMLCSASSDVSISPWYRPVWDMLKSQGRLGREDFISMHLYGGYVSSFYSFGYHLKEINKWRDEYPELKSIPLHITEYSGDSMNNQLNDKPIAGAFAIKAARFFMDNRVDQSYYFSVVDFLYGEYNLHFKGGLGLFTRTGIGKPALNGFRLLKQLKGGHRLPLTASNDPADGLAVLMPDGSIRVLITSFAEANLNSEAPFPVSLEIKLPDGFQPADAISTLYFDNYTANSLLEYEKMGSPAPAGKDDPVPYQINEKLKLGQGAITDFTCENGVLKAYITMPLNSGMLLCISRK